MLAQIYQYTTPIVGSIRRARLIDEIEIERIPKDQVKFANEHGGDFIEILEDSLVG
jgi:hypothetical protein